MDKIRPSVEVAAAERAAGAELSADEFVERVAHENTRRQMYDILQRSAVLRDLFERGQIGLAAGIYSVDTGEVDVFDTMIEGAAGPVPVQTTTARLPVAV